MSDETRLYRDVTVRGAATIKNKAIGLPEIPITTRFGTVIECTADQRKAIEKATGREFTTNDKKFLGRAEERAVERRFAKGLLPTAALDPDAEETETEGETEEVVPEGGQAEGDPEPKVEAHEGGAS